MICYPIRILITEDNVDQLLLTERSLRKFNPEIEVCSVKTGRECLDLLSREEFSAVILDYNLPRMDGMEVIRSIRQSGSDVPVIMVTGQGDELVAVEAMKSGACDYIVKTQGYLKNLPGIVEKTIEKHHLEVQLKASEEKYRRLAENANDLIFTTDKNGNFTFLTHRVQTLLGYSVEQLLGKNFVVMLDPSSKEKAEAEFSPESRGETTKLVELDFLTKSGEKKSFELSITTLLQSGRVIGFEAIGRDITQRRMLQKEILQRNKELTTLLSVSSAIAHSLNIEEICKASLEKICEFTGLSCGAVFILRFTDSLLQLSGSFELPERAVKVLQDKSVWQEVLDLFERDKRLLLNRDLEQLLSYKSRLIEVCQQERIESFVLLPLVFKERLLGFIFAGSFSDSAFAPPEIEVLKSICSQISVALASARLFNAVREGKTEWETTFDAMSELICMQDLEGRIIRVNRAMARRLELEPREIVNRRAVEIFLDEMSPWCHHQKPEMYESNKIISMEFEDKVLNGIFEIASTPIYNTEGRLVAWLFVGKDITEQRQLQNQFVQVERLKALGEMASGVDHDFNNILAGVLGKTQVMLKNLERGILPDLPTLEQNLRLIEMTTIRGSHTVKRIQDFTRIRTDQKFDSVDVNQIVRDTIDRMRPVWKDQREAKGIKIDLQFNPGIVPLIKGISSELTEVIVNIVTNSIDAMPDGGIVQISTQVHLAGTDEYIEIKIADTGVGMTNEVKRKIFDPFFSTKGPKGTGLGMSVAYGIISRHQGNITIDSELGKGTTCRLYLPAAKRVEKTSVVRATPMDKQKLRLLVIEDEDVIRDFLVEMFVSAGYEADAAATGGEGIGLFEVNKYDLVFSDLGLPDMSGWDVAKSIKAKNPVALVVLLSGWGIQLDDVRIQESGIDLVLSKPCQMEELLTAVQEVLRRRRPNRS